jgi:uncharacterized RDD family membrane protein YckC
MGDEELVDLSVSVVILAVGLSTAAWMVRRSVPPSSQLLTGSPRSKRYFAAVIDHLGAILLLMLGGMAMVNFSETYMQGVPRWALGIAGCLLYLVYYLVLEAIFSTTPGKAFYGLRVLQLNGERCTWRCAWIRTLTRLIEVNPVLLGGIPAGIVILRTRRHQRIGDILAGTVVTSQRAKRIPHTSGESTATSG